MKKFMQISDFLLIMGTVEAVEASGFSRWYIVIRKMNIISHDSDKTKHQ